SFWTHIVQLTLNVQYPFELILIFQNGTIALLKHLSITIEQEGIEKNLILKELSVYIIVRQCKIHQMMDATGL
ncbi:unnamed protein product, partial [Rotaria sordida]